MEEGMLKLFLTGTITDKPSVIESVVEEIRSVAFVSNHIAMMSVRLNSSDPDAAIESLTIICRGRILTVELRKLDYIPKCLRDLLADPSFKFYVDSSEKVEKFKNDYGLVCNKSGEFAANYFGEPNLLGANLKELAERVARSIIE